MGDKKKKPGKFGFIFIGIVLGLLFYVWQHIQVICMGYKISELDGLAVSLEEKNNLLRRKVSKHTNYEEIEKIARGRLNMVYPDPENIVYLIK